MKFKKMAGTSAVFVIDGEHTNKPVEVQGMVWNSEELKLHTQPEAPCEKPPIATSLALEGLESYEPPSHGDLRRVTALDANFMYIAPIKGWVEFSK